MVLFLGVEVPELLAACRLHHKSITISFSILTLFLTICYWALSQLGSRLDTRFLDCTGWRLQLSDTGSARNKTLMQPKGHD